MPARLDFRKLGDESGFTLIELLVAMSLSLVVGLILFGTFDTFNSNASRQTRVNDANDEVRTAMDRVVSDVRQTRTIEVADANDFVYTVTDSATQTRRERICLDGAGGLWRASVKTASPPTVPIPSGSACPIPGSGAIKIADLVSANSATNPLFRYDSATPANVRSVGLTFALNADNPRRTDTSTLRASAFIRARRETAPPVTDSDISTVCGGSGPLLTLSTGVGSLTVSYRDIDGNALGSAAAGASVQLTAGTTKVVANVSGSTGSITQLVKTLAC